ncbi:cytidylate kinase-like family protein [Lachnospiraceae bacterium 62-35]
MKRQIITISREYGSGGREIGRMTAEQLGIPFYDREIIEETAREAGMSPEFVEGHEEKLNNAFFYNFAVGAIYGLAHPDKPDLKNLPATERIFLAQKKVIEDMAEKGPCVVIGRCADFILRDREDVLKVFIYADMDSRKKRVIEEYGRLPEYIDQTVAYVDKRRRLHYETYTIQDWGDRKNYHLMLDSSAFGLEECAKIICKAMG